MKIALPGIFFMVFFFGTTRQAYAWVYPEHRQIALLAVQELGLSNRLVLDKLWSQARMGFEGRLTKFVIEPTQGLHPTQLDFASWAAISGDHSCSPANMLFNVLHTDWILNVAHVAAQLDSNVHNAKTNAQRINALHSSDIQLLKADNEYATRAGSNNVHFLLARPDVNTKILQYLAACLNTGAALNALGAYAWFHTSALSKASRYASEHLSEADKNALILAALADEAFALHFLEDAFAAGHIAGTWGNAAVRKGTHDYYNERGLEVASWNGSRAIHMGDAYMRKEDAETAAATVRISLEQLIKVANGQISIDYPDDPSIFFNRPDSFNVCKSDYMPSRKYDSVLLREIFVTTPVPGLATGLGELPRFRSELGPFIGISASLNAASLFGGFGKEQTRSGGTGGLEANIRFGYGMDGVLNNSGDGLFFVEVGWRQDAASTHDIFNNAISSNFSITSALPARSAYNLRVRMPFWLIPGDLILASPFLLLTNPQALQHMAVTAGNGGLIPWQSAINTGIGRFQFVLGREVGLSFYGLRNPKDAIIIPESGNDYVLEYRSTKIDFPILEYRHLRKFSQDQSSSLMVQINGGVDIPSHEKIIVAPLQGGPMPEMKKLWYLGLRILFNWRHYL